MIVNLIHALHFINIVYFTKFPQLISFFSFQQLEQEKHQLRNQIEVMEDEYEQRISDLQSDLNIIRQRLQVRSDWLISFNLIRILDEF